MKHLFTMLLTLVAVTASAQDFEVDDICYNILSEDDRTVEVTENPNDYAGEVVIPGEVTYDGSTYSVTTIGVGAFDTCLALTSVSMPEATTIGEHAFYNCSALTSVEMPSITTISDFAFTSCTSLTSIYIPASCTSIIGNPFIYCNSMEEIVVDEENQYYSSLDGVLYDKSINTLVSCPVGKTTIEVPPTVTTISDYALCSQNLTSVKMPSVTTIGNFSLSDCKSLTSLEMPLVTTIGDNAFCWSSLKSVYMPFAENIGNYAFFSCFSLASIYLPATIDTIGENALASCGSLRNIYCHWEQPLECNPGFEDEIFMNATLYVPTGTVDAYRSTFPWSEFANIEERDYSGIADTPGSGLSVKVIDGAIVIKGGDSTASAPVVEVYSAGGQCVYRGTDSSIGGLPRGVYVVKVDGTVQKVALRQVE